MTEDQQNRVRRDLTRAACDELSEVINRRARVAATVLDNADLTLMLTDIAGSVLAGAVVFGIQNAKPSHAGSMLEDILEYVTSTARRRHEKMQAVAAALNTGADLCTIAGIINRSDGTDEVVHG